MSPDHEESAYKLLSTLRALESHLGRLRSRWRSFREDPSPAALTVVRAQVEHLSSELRELARELEGATPEWSPASDRERAAPGGALRPTARHVVSASRELDAGIGEAVRAWKEVIDRPDAQRLRHLATILAGSARQAVTLLEALGGMRPSHSTPRRRTAPFLPGSAIDRIEMRSTELESLIWRIRSDWHHVRRAPTIERIGRLQSELAEAADCTEELRLDVGTAGSTAFRRALRIGIHSADAVRFLPFRDPLTGVYNRQGFDSLAGAELKRCRRYRRRFGLLLVRIEPTDLEDLRRTVVTARAELREYDLIGRYLEDQLIIGIPEGGRGATRRVASRLLRALRRSGNRRPVTGLGYSTSPEDGSTLSGLVDAAAARIGDSA